MNRRHPIAVFLALCLAVVGCGGSNPDESRSTVADSVIAQDARQGECAPLIGELDLTQTGDTWEGTMSLIVRGGNETTYEVTKTNSNFVSGPMAMSLHHDTEYVLRSGSEVAFVIRGDETIAFSHYPYPIQAVENATIMQGESQVEVGQMHLDIVLDAREEPWTSTADLSGTLCGLR